MDKPDPQKDLLDQIEEISKNARSTWFGLLAVQVFIVVTLMSHRDSNFFAFGAVTELPVVGIEVPTAYFFIGAPLLLSSLFCYLHLYLVPLWSALGRLEPRRNDRPIDEFVYPTLIARAALGYRATRRGDESKKPCMERHAMTGAVQTICVLLLWILGIAILTWAWWRSMPLHDPILSLIILGCLGFALFTGWNGLVAFHRCLALIPGSPGAEPDQTRWRLISSIVVVLALVTLGRTDQDFEFAPLARADMVRATLTTRPDDWKPYVQWREDFRFNYMERLNKRKGWQTPNPNFQAPTTKKNPVEAMREATQHAWETYSRSLRRANNADGDLRRADLTRAFWPGADLRRADLTGAILERTILTGAVIRSGVLRGANLHRAHLEAVNFEPIDEVFVPTPTDFTGAVMTRVNLTDAYLNNAILRGVDLWRANLDGADVAGWDIKGASLRRAKLKGARNLTQDHLDQAFGDDKTQIPNDLMRPSHWGKSYDPEAHITLDKDEAYQKWLDDKKNQLSPN